MLSQNLEPRQNGTDAVQFYFLDQMPKKPSVFTFSGHALVTSFLKPYWNQNINTDI